MANEISASDIDDPEAYPNSCDPRSCDCDEVGFTTQRDGVHVILDKVPVKARMDTGTYAIVVPSDPEADNAA